MKTRYVGWLLCLILCPSLAAAQGMWIDKDAFVPGEAITVHFSAPGSYADNAWVGIIPSQVAHGREAENDRHDLSYQYLHKKTSGTLTFRAPTQAGAYDLRMHDTDSNGRETASVSFTVAAAPVAAGPTLRLGKSHFAPGEAITVHFSAPGSYADNAWVGIIPSQVAHGREAENDRHDLSYQYLHKKTSGTLTFRAPAQAGAYDVRMHDTDSNGRETASVSFTVSH